ncbi:MAG: EamA family transporter [Gammaproteobacteria bacterium]|nr:EamA family transporter [Gammaproteobacteria bacterium]
MQSNREDKPYFGILLFLGNLIVMVAISALAKRLVEDYPVSQVLFFRYLFVAIPMIALVTMTLGFSTLKITRYRDYAVRTSAGIVSLGLFFYAISKIPLAEATLLSYISPIFIVMLSIPVLGEKIGVYRWAAVLMGFVGVFIIVQPGTASFNLGTMAAVGASMGSAIVSIWLRLLSTTEKVSTINAIHNSMGAIVFGCWIWIEGWVAPQGFFDWGLLVSIGLLGCFQQYLFASSFRFSEASLIAPFEYLILVFSAAVGYWFWSEIPVLTTWIGGIIIVCCGLSIMYRQHYHQKKAADTTRNEQGI